MNLREETNFLLNKYNLKANKKLGQNFLINEEIIDKIVTKSGVTNKDTIIEIGPGLGSLTAKLAEVAKEVIAIELDVNMVKILNERFVLYNNVKIIHGDILKINLNEIIQNRENVKVVANLPYYITTPIVMRLLEEEVDLESITVMVQKEVGERFCSLPGNKEYGAITVSINYYTTPEIIIDVDKDNFYPIPEVDSCVVKLNIRANKPEVLDNKNFFKIIKIAFSQRRKNLTNSLMGIGKTKDEVRDMLIELGIDCNKRAENLSLQDFINISNFVS